MAQESERQEPQETGTESRVKERVLAHVDWGYIKIAAYVLVTVFVFLAIVLLCRASVGFWKTLGAILSAIGTPLIYGLIITYLLMPLTNFFDRKFSSGQSKGAIATASRAGAVFLTLAILLGALFAVLLVLFVTFSHQLSGLKLDRASLEAFVQQVSGQYSDLVNQLLDFLQKQGLNADSIAASVQSSLGGTVGVLKNLTFGLIFSVYFLYDGQRIGEYWKKVVNALIEPRFMSGWRQFAQDVDQAFSGYIRGQVIDAVLVGVLVSVAMSIAAVPYGILVGLITGFGNLIPYFGPILGYATIIIGCLFSGNMSKLVLGIVLLAIIQFIDGNIINPRLLSNAIHIHPLYVVVCVIAGGAMGGIAGMLISVPLGALIKKEFERFLEFRKKQRAAGEDAQPLQESAAEK